MPGLFFDSAGVFRRKSYEESWVMVVSSRGLGLVTLVIGVGYAWFTLFYAALGFGFSLTTLVGPTLVGPIHVGGAR
jgi:hypothetical protein